MTTSRRTFVQLMAMSGAAAAVGGCDPGADLLQRMLAGESGDDFRPPESGEIDDAAHVINRLTWGPTPGLYRAVRTAGVDAFIDEQLDPDSIGDWRCDRRVAGIESLAEPVAELYEYDPGRLLVDLSRHKILRSVYSRRQLYEVMIDFWTDHFNIVSEKGDCRWLKAADDRHVIRAHALGRFRDLLRASALSPAMLIYLDGHDNKVVDPGDRPNENYARELLELHTLGVHGGYSQRDVAEVARCLSGWTYENRPFRFRAASVDFDPARHDAGEKVVLGQTIHADDGRAELEQVLDVVCRHPATASNIATRLCRRFIAETPPAAAVEIVADAFRRTDGDIRATLRALFETDAFRSARGTLFKRPLRFVVSALRVSDASTDAGPAVQEALARMGHAPFQYPSPDGYPLEAAPWLGSLLWRWNFAIALAGEDSMGPGLPGTAADVGALVTALGGAEAERVVEPLCAHVLGRRGTERELEVLRGTARPLALLLSSPAFQVH